MKKEEKHIYHIVAYQSKHSRVNTCGSHVVHHLYKLNNDSMSLPDYYQFTKSTKDQTNVSCDVIVAEFVNRKLSLSKSGCD